MPHHLPFSKYAVAPRGRSLPSPPRGSPTPLWCPAPRARTRQPFGLAVSSSSARPNGAQRSRSPGAPGASLPPALRRPATSRPHAAGDGLARPSWCSPPGLGAPPARLASMVPEAAPQPQAPLPERSADPCPAARCSAPSRPGRCAAT